MNDGNIIIFLYEKLLEQFHHFFSLLFENLNCNTFLQKTITTTTQPSQLYKLMWPELKNQHNQVLFLSSLIKNVLQKDIRSAVNIRLMHIMSSRTYFPNVITVCFPAQFNGGPKELWYSPQNFPITLA